MRLSQVRRSTGWVLSLAVVGLAACETTTAPPLPEPPAPPAAQVRVEVAEPGEDGVVNTAVIGPVFRAVGADGSPAAGVTMTFTALNGGSLEHASATTDAAGLATPGAWTLGPRAAAQSVSAVVNGPAAVSSVTGLAGPFASFYAPPAIAGRVFDTGADIEDLVFFAVDEFGNRVAEEGIPVAFAALNGSLAGAGTETDENGQVSAGTWTLSGNGGPQQVRAAYAGPGGPAETLLTVTETPPPAP